MVFSSVSFLFAFLPITILLYFVVPEKCKNIVLLICSLLFYAWGEPVYVFLMMLSIGFNYVIGLNIESDRKDAQRAKADIIFAVVVNLSLLAFFKYYGFLVSNLNAVLPFDIPYRELDLPIGISFYTFQAMSYVIDVYRNKVKVQHSLLKFGVYISMFPQLIAGPIVQYSDIEKQLEKRTVNMTKLGDGVLYFIRGLAKKVIIANSVGLVFSKISGMEFISMSVLTAWLGAISYAFQIYFDFSGYSDMAIGLGKMFGFEFMKNFDYPYTSRSVTEFWRRWHISLSRWFREYVYIPLGGNRKGKQRTIINLLIVWGLTGLWHGANWTFICWGLYYGVILILERFVFYKFVERLPNAVRHLYTMVLVLIGWVFFFSPDLGYAGSYIGVMFGIGAKGLVDRQFWFLLLTNWVLYILAGLGSTTVGFYWLDRIVYNYHNGQGRREVACVVYTAMFLITVAYLISETFNPFLYFRF
ncbi:MAG: MBOAT family protein [Hespellia sp.]|nr:MBOAT family protein [Hespellia sp.]